MEVIGIIVTLVGLLTLLCFVVRHREKVGRWLRDPSTPSSIDPDARRKRLLRAIEDAKDELTRLDEEGR